MSNDDGRPASRRLYERAKRVIPGGVHSPVRAFGRVGGTPVFVRSATGSRIEDADGRSYVDFCMAFGPLILGHAHPAVLAAVDEACRHGWSYGTADERSLELAEFITARIPWVEQVRFVNSGTEAVMTALRLARAATGRQRVLKFDGCYHGHVDAMLVRAGSGLAGEPDSAGLTPGVTADTLVAPLDDEAALERTFECHGAELAAAIIEPVPANSGLLPQRPGFLRRLAELCRRHGALLVLDEVITGFRLGFGGHAGRSGLHPDLVTWGKIIGGGFPVGAVAGHRDLMERLAPIGPVYQAGTLSGNPVAMAAGLATLKELADTSAYDRLEALGRRLEEGLAAVPGMGLQRDGSIFWLLPSGGPGPVRTPATAPPALAEEFAGLYHRLLDAGIYLPPSPWEVGFLSLGHDEADVDGLVAALPA